MERILLAVGILLVCFLILWWLLRRKKHEPDGYIYLEKNEDGDDRIRFYLNMEYEEIGKYEEIVFKVVNNKAMQ